MANYLKLELVPIVYDKSSLFYIKVSHKTKNEYLLSISNGFFTIRIGYNNTSENLGEHSLKLQE